MFVCRSHKCCYDACQSVAAVVFIGCLYADGGTEKAWTQEYRTCICPMRYHSSKTAQDRSTDKSNGAKGVDISVAELAVSGYFCYRVLSVAESASCAAAMLTEMAGSVQVKNAKFVRHSGDTMS